MKCFILLFFLFSICSISAEPKTKASAGAVQTPPPAKADKSPASAVQTPTPAKAPARNTAQAKAGKKTTIPEVQPPPVKAKKLEKKSNTRRVNQFSDVDLDQAVSSLSTLLKELPALCQNGGALTQKVKKFQQKMTLIKQTIRQIKEDFIINSPGLHSYINTLDFYLNESKEFNYEKEIPVNTKELKEYVSGLALSFLYMYQMAFNIPEDTPLNELPKGWSRSIGTALHCLENHK